MKSLIRKMLAVGVLLCTMLVLETHAGILVKKGLTREKIVRMGETHGDSIDIQNTGTSTEELRIYQTDYFFYSDGRNFYDEPGTVRRSNANWIRFSPRHLAIPPNGTGKVDYSIKVPDGASLIGTYWSMLMVERVPNEDEIMTSTTLPQTLRYGIQMITHISDTGLRRLKFLNTKLLKEKEKRILQVDMENTGERYLEPFVWVKLYDEAGNYTDRFDAEKSRVYPATSIRFTIDLTSVSKGTYNAMVVADCGGDDIFGVTYSLKFTE